MPNLYIRKLGTGEIVHTTHLSNPDPRHAEKVLRGMLMRINTDEYYVDDSEIGIEVEGDD